MGVHRTTILWSLSPSEGAHPMGIRMGIPHSCFSYYPTAEEKAGIQGKTRLQMTVTEEGDVRDLVVVTSSGNANLDNAALRCASRWRYKAAIQNGKPVAVTWMADAVWKIEIPQPPPFAEPPRDCVHSYPIKAGDLVGIDGTTEVTFDIVKGEVRDPEVTHASGNATLDKDALDCIASRRYVRETVLFNGKAVDRYRSLTIRERVNWADALKPVTPPATSPN